MAQLPTPISTTAAHSRASSTSFAGPSTARSSRLSASKPPPLAAFGVGTSTPQTLLPSPPPTPTSQYAPPESFLPDMNTPRTESPALGLFDLRSGGPLRPGRSGRVSPAEEDMGMDLADLGHARLGDLEAGLVARESGPSSLRRASRGVPTEIHPLGGDEEIEEDPRRKRSLQPWEYIEPPPDNNAAVGGAFSETKGFHTLREKTSHPLIPKSSYYFGPPPPGSAYGTEPMGTIGVHHPREVVRLERDYTGGEVVQFSTAYPLELEGRITPTQFLEAINSLNEILIDAHSLRHAFFDNCLEIFSLQLSRFVLSTHYDKQMRRLRHRVDELNAKTFNPVGLNVLWPHKVAFLFLEIEYY